MLVNKKINRSVIYLLVFLFSLHLTPAVYINSSFLGKFIGENNVGYVYSIASVLTIASFLLLRKILRKKGNYKTTIGILVIETLSLLGMALAPNAPIAIISYTINFITTSVVWFNLDIFLEENSENESTGGTRGFYMTFANLAFLIGPFIASFILSGPDFWKVYVLGIIINVPVFYVLIRYLKNFKDPIYEKSKIFKTFLKIKQNTDLYSTFMAGLLLRIFYAVAVVYVPLFLISEIGFSVSETTMIIGIALLPFTLFELLFGKIADKYLGEEELLTSGFIIIALSTATISFITSSNIVIWTAVLFVTRIGAAMIEMMTEAHLFKRINSDNINILGLFRSVSPFSYIITPLVVSILLIFIDFKYIFLILGIVMLYGLRYSLSIKDTK